MRNRLIPKQLLYFLITDLYPRVKIINLNRRYIPLATLIACVALSLGLIYEGPYKSYRYWQDQQHTAAGDGAAAQPDLPQTVSYDLDQIVATHLFGKAQAPAPPPAPAKAPETTLKLSLLGMITSENPRFARAFIGVSNSKVKSYGVGRTIDGTDAVVQSVVDRGVLLDRAGKIEILTMKIIGIDNRGIDNRSAATPASAAAGGSVQPVSFAVKNAEIRYSGLKKLNGKHNKMPL